MSIDGVGSNTTTQAQDVVKHNEGAEEAQDKEKGGFGSVMSKVADGALAGVSAVAPALPGGELVGQAADGLRELKGSAPDQMPDAQDDQLDQMFEMQEQNQAFNLQYLELQNQMQQHNREFETLSNLMQVRHDTAKSAINNMRV